METTKESALRWPLPLGGDEIARLLAPDVEVQLLTAEDYPDLLDRLHADGAEFIAHGLSVTRPQTSAMTPDEERDYIAETLQRLRRCGLEPRGWFGADNAESTLTPQLLGEFGLEYLSDWANDEQPYRMTTPGRLVATPLWADFDDQTVLINRMCNLDMFEDHFIKALDQLDRDAGASARLFHFAVRPWVMGAPLRIAAFERVLAHACARPRAWTPTLGEVVDAWWAQQAPEARDG